MRASHADREHVIGVLKAAFVQGRLEQDEFDLRVGQTFAARTYEELAAVTADLPAGLAAAQPPPLARAPGEGRLVAGIPGTSLPATSTTSASASSGFWPVVLHW